MRIATTLRLLAMLSLKPSRQMVCYGEALGKPREGTLPIQICFHVTIDDDQPALVGEVRVVGRDRRKRHRRQRARQERALGSGLRYEGVFAVKAPSRRGCIGLLP